MLLRNLGRVLGGHGQPPNPGLSRLASSSRLLGSSLIRAFCSKASVFFLAGKFVFVFCGGGGGVGCHTVLLLATRAEGFVPFFWQLELRFWVSESLHFGLQGHGAS